MMAMISLRIQADWSEFSLLACEYSGSFWQKFNHYRSLAISADDKLMNFFLFIPRKRIWNFMQIVSTGDNLHEISNPVSWEKNQKKKINMSSAENFTQSAKG